MNTVYRLVSWPNTLILFIFLHMSSIHCLFFYMMDQLCVYVSLIGPTDHVTHYYIVITWCIIIIYTFCTFHIFEHFLHRCYLTYTKHSSSVSSVAILLRLKFWFCCGGKINDGGWQRQQFRWIFYEVYDLLLVRTLYVTISNS